MKITIMTIITLMLFTPVTLYAQFDTSKIIENQQKALKFDDMENAIESLIGPESNQIVPKFDMKEIVGKLSTGNASFDVKEMLNRTIKYLFKEIYSNFNTIIKIIILTILCSLLQNLKSSFGEDGVGEIAFYSCYILLSAILIKDFVAVLDIGREVITSLVSFMQVFIPTVFALLMATGNISSVTVMQPTLVVCIGIISVLIKKVILPLILFYTILTIVNNISQKIHITKIAEFINNVGVWLITISLTVFTGILSMQSSITKVADGIGSKTAKFAVNTFVPVVGKLLSSTVETVAGCSIVLKNSLSVVGMLVIILICLIPVIKLFSLIIIYKLAAVAIEPISDDRIVKCISQMVKSLTLLIAAVISVGVLFIICITILVNAGNTASMLR